MLVDETLGLVECAAPDLLNRDRFLPGDVREGVRQTACDRAAQARGLDRVCGLELVPVDDKAETHG